MDELIDQILITMIETSDNCEMVCELITECKRLEELDS